MQKQKVKHHKSKTTPQTKKLNTKAIKKTTSGRIKNNRIKNKE
ncbi:hypothetical protein [Helicobacter pylori]|nr:hypothetical protein [Helicobacter pylori]